MSTPYFQDETVTLHHGDCLDVLRSLPDNSVDSVVTDPPYGISFMGKAWDQPGEFGSARGNGTPGVHRRGADRPDEKIGDTGAMDAGTYDLSPSAMKNFQRWCEAWATECLRVLKPGGYLVSFGGSRTWHRLAAAVEDSGFEIRDSIAWLYGSGFPKSLDVSKAIDKAAGVDRPVIGTTKAGASSLSRVSRVEQGYRDKLTDVTPDDLAITAPVTDAAREWNGWGTALKPSFEPIVVGRKPFTGSVAVNVLTHGTGAINVDACRIEGRERTDYGLSASRRSQGATYGAPSVAADFDASKGRWPTNVLLDDSQAAVLDDEAGPRRAGSTPANRRGIGFTENGRNSGTSGAKIEHDGGGASRFFPTFHYEAKAPTSERPNVDGVQHPTVKPLNLMRWLVRLVTPPNGVVLEPFAGSGTTAEACVHEHMQCIAIEREASYLPLIVDRLTKPIEVGLDFGTAS